MRRGGAFLLAVWLALGLAAFAQAPASTPSLTLPAVLAALDQAGPRLNSLDAEAEVDDFTALVNNSSLSSGHLYFERASHGPRYVLQLTQPPDAAKTLVYRDDNAYIYIPASKQVDVYSLKKQATAVEQYLLLGLGATGQQLQASYHIVLDPPTTLGGVPVVELTLAPRDAAAATRVPRIALWFDPAQQWVEVQQQMWQPGGDYHQVRYTSIRINPSLPDSVFSTHFAGATVVSH